MVSSSHPGRSVRSHSRTRDVLQHQIGGAGFYLPPPARTRTRTFVELSPCSARSPSATHGPTVEIPICCCDRTIAVAQKPANERRTEGGRAADGPAHDCARQRTRCSDQSAQGRRIEGKHQNLAWNNNRDAAWTMGDASTGNSDFGGELRMMIPSTGLSRRKLKRPPPQSRN